MWWEPTPPFLLVSMLYLFCDPFRVDDEVLCLCHTGLSLAEVSSSLKATTTEWLSWQRKKATILRYSSSSQSYLHLAKLEVISQGDTEDVSKPKWSWLLGPPEAARSALTVFEPLASLTGKTMVCSGSSGLWVSAWSTSFLRKARDGSRTSSLLIPVFRFPLLGRTEFDFSHHYYGLWRTALKLALRRWKGRSELTAGSWVWRMHQAHILPDPTDQLCCMQVSLFGLFLF